jgi:hypothetical protein
VNASWRSVLKDAAQNAMAVTSEVCRLALYRTEDDILAILAAVSPGPTVDSERLLSGLPA